MLDENDETTSVDNDLLSKYDDQFSNLISEKGAEIYKKTAEYIRSNKDEFLAWKKFFKIYHLPIDKVGKWCYYITDIKNEAKTKEVKRWKRYLIPVRCVPSAVCALLLLYPLFRFQNDWQFSRKPKGFLSFSVIFLGSDFVRFIYGKMLRSNIRFGRCMSWHSYSSKTILQYLI